MWIIILEGARSQACSPGLVSISSYCLKACPLGYYQVDTTCQPCGSACQQCTSVNKCTQCQPRFFVSSRFKCNSDCTVAYNGTCVSNCPLGTFNYYFNTTDNFYCSPCSPNCKGCSSYSNCTACQAPLTLSGNLCTCSNCAQCNPPNSTLTDSGLCVVSCPSGYYQSQDYQCSICPTGCANCQQGPANIINCNYCFQNLYLLNQTCVNDCPNGYFVNQGFCTRAGCPSGTYLFSNKQLICQPCLTGCLTCSNGSSVCTSCSPGYYSNQTSPNANYTNCYSCQGNNCDQCDSSGCTTCQPQFFLSSKTCQSCLPACLNCTNSSTCVTCIQNSVINANSTACECQSGFFLKQTNIYTCMACQASCLACSVSEVNCTSCNKGYYLNPDNACVKCGNLCTSCSSTTCTTCGSNAVVLSGSNCKCMAGFAPVVNGTSCSTCPIECSTCSTSTQCTSCAVSYYLIGTVCTPCKQNCQSCTAYTSCLRCRSGYEIVSNNCAQVWKIVLISIGVALLVVALIMVSIVMFKKYIRKNTQEYPEQLQEDFSGNRPGGPF